MPVTGAKTQNNPNNPTMKKYITFASRAAIAAIAATGLCFVSTTKAADETKSGSETKTKSSLSANDKKFVKKAYKGGMEEVENGKMAKEKAKNDATKDVAEHMITDHTKANEALMDIAKEENLDLSKVHAKPMKISGDDFDKEYLTMLKKDHEKDIAEFEKEANDAVAGEDSDVTAFAKKTLPTLKDHLKMVEDALTKAK
jgi:putative membrane protein